MASRTTLQLITLTNQQTGIEVVDDTFDASGNTTTSGLVAALKNQPDNKYIGRHLYIDGGSPTIRSHIIDDSTQSTGEIQWPAALGAAPDSLDFMILPFSRDDTLNAIVDAILALHDDGTLVRPVTSWSLVGGSPLYNAGWDYWTGTNTVDGWARNGTGTVERERLGSTSVTYTNNQSLKLSTVADYIGLSAPWDKFLEDLKGQTVNFYCPVWAANASHARINFYTGSDNYSSYHTGGGEWEILETGDIDIAVSATNLQPRLYNDDTNAVYFGRPWIKTNIGIRDYPFPAALFTRIEKIRRSQPVLEPDGDGRVRATNLGSLPLVHGYDEMFFRDEATSTEMAVLHFDKAPLQQSVMVIEGSGPLAVPSTDSAEVEVDQTESYLIANLAAAKLLEDKAQRVSEPSATSYRLRAGNLRARADELKGGYSRAKRKSPVLQVVM